jgi:hypothetical protein
VAQIETYKKGGRRFGEKVRSNSTSGKFSRKVQSSSKGGQKCLGGKRDLHGMITLGNAPFFMLSILGGLHANKTIEDNPVHPRTEITTAEIEALKVLAKSLDSLIGFAKLDHLYIFKGKAVSFDNSVVLAM